MFHNSLFFLENWLSESAEIPEVYEFSNFISNEILG